MAYVGKELSHLESLSPFPWSPQGTSHDKHSLHASASCYLNLVSDHRSNRHFQQTAFLHVYGLGSPSVWQSPLLPSWPCSKPQPWEAFLTSHPWQVIISICDYEAMAAKHFLEDKNGKFCHLTVPAGPGT